MIRLSIVIPGYNNSDANWNRCLKSVLLACGPDDEVLCVDDGSRSRPVVAIEDTRIRWIYLKSNVGQSAARNQALAVASGEWVAFVDSDDEVEPSVFNTSIDRLNQGGADIAVFGVRGISLRERLTRFDLPQSADIGVLTATSARKIYNQRLFEYVWNKVFRRDFLIRHGIEFPVGLCPGEDTIFNLTCAINGAKWCTVPVVGYRYYRYDGTSLSRYLPRRADAYREKARQWKAFAEKVGDPTGCLRDLATYTDADWVRMEWYNIWRKGSPFSLRERWRFLRQHAELFSRPLCVTYLKKAIFTLLRTYCYFSWVYRWHICRLYPDMERLPK